MRSRDLTSEQLKALQDRLEPIHDYLHRLKARMARQGFDADDPLMARVAAVDDAVGALSLELASLAIEREAGPP